jgi:hypothetical protein
MSFKVPRPSRARSQSSSPSKTPSTSFSLNEVPPRHQLVLPSAAPKMRHGHGTKGRVQYRNNEVLAEPLGRVFLQEPPANPQTYTSIAIPLDPDDPFVDIGDAEPPSIYVVGGGEDPQLGRQRQRRKKERQWAKWANETIPALIQPYLLILRESDNLRQLKRQSNATLPACSCARRASISVTCVFFERKYLYLQ